MIGKKDSICIFEQYRGIIREQNDDLLTQVKKSALDPKVKQQLIALLSDPAVAAKWRGGDADTVNKPNAKFGKELSTAKYGAPDQDTANEPDPNFAREMEAARKAQEDAYPESEVKKFLGEEDEDEEDPLNFDFDKQNITPSTPEEREAIRAQDPASYFSGLPKVKNGEYGPMKFEPRVAPTVKTPQQKAEEEAYWAAQQEVHRERKEAAINQALANRKPVANYNSNIKIGAKRTDPNYEQKKAEWVAAFAAGAGGK